MKNDINENVNVPVLILVTDWNKYFDYPKLGTLRKLIFEADTNGFNKVIRRIQSRVLINVSEYFKWVDETNGIIPDSQN